MAATSHLKPQRQKEAAQLTWGVERNESPVITHIWWEHLLRADCEILLLGVSSLKALMEAYNSKETVTETQTLNMEVIREDHP